MALKIRLAHYAHMKQEILALGIDFKRVHQQYLDQGRSEKRFRWDIARLAGLIPYMCNTLYHYLNDDHIDSALRQILDREINRKPL